MTEKARTMQNSWVHCVTGQQQMQAQLIGLDLRLASISQCPITRCTVKD